MQIVFVLQKPGDAVLDIFNERADLAAMVSDPGLPAGLHSSRVDLAGLAPGVYFYKVTLKYSDGSVERLKAGKFLRIR